MTERESTATALDQFERLATSRDYEQIRDGLTAVIQLLEQPNLGLHDSVRAYEVGRLLAERCQELLDAAELRITQLDSAETGAA